MSKTVVISDIHNKYWMAEGIIELEHPDKVVFLGDYFDSYGDDANETSYHTARWLSESVEKKNRVHIVGNHDLTYLSKGRFSCSGYNEFKLWTINKWMNKEKWNKLVSHCWVGDWLCTHAGLSNLIFKKYGIDRTVQQFMLECEDELRSLDMNGTSFMCSNARGGLDQYSGIYWCDYDEFRAIPDINQIFGHTRQDKVRWSRAGNSQNICLDTGLQDYLVLYEDNMPLIKSVMMEQGVKIQ